MEEKGFRKWVGWGLAPRRLLRLSTDAARGGYKAPAIIFFIPVKAIISEARAWKPQKHFGCAV